MIHATLTKQVIGKDKRGHGFHDGNGAGEDAGIVATFALELGVFAVGINGFLIAHDGGGGLEGDAEDDVFAVGYSALDSARAVGAGADFTVHHAEGVIVLAACEEGAGKTGADFKTLGGREGKHGFGEVCLEFIENGFTEAGWAIADDALDHSADGVSIGTDRLDALDHRIDHGGIARADDVRLDDGGGDGFGIDGGVEVLDGFHPGKDLDAGVE